MEFNRKRSGLGEKFHQLAKKVVSECGYILYDDDYIAGSSTLRVYIMDEKSHTAVIEDCIKVDRAFTPHCETLEWIPNDFVLEVSSPGVFRTLKTKEHFQSSLKEMVLLQLNSNLVVDETVSLSKSVLKNKKIRCEISNVFDEELEIVVEDQKLRVPFLQIKKANLDPDLHG